MAFDMTRIQAFETKTSGPFPIALGADVEVTVNVQSLGEWHNFANIRVNPTARPRFRMTYEYDLATAKFVLHYTP